MIRMVEFNPKEIEKDRKRNYKERLKFEIPARVDEKTTEQSLEQTTKGVH